jgi:hypothetical protein
VVYVTHDPRMAKYARRLIQIRDGRITSDEANTAASLALASPGQAMPEAGSAREDGSEGETKPA